MSVRAALCFALAVIVLPADPAIADRKVEKAAPLDPDYQRVDPGHVQLRHAFADCSTANNTPVAPCNDWMTGPASAQNAGAEVYRWNNSAGIWQPATLRETDQGWLVMNPGGTSLELVAFGDTYVDNPAYTVAQRQADIEACAKMSIAGFCGTDKNCTSFFKTEPDRPEACAYWLARSNHINPVKGLSQPVFSSQNNVVFMDAETDQQSPYRFRFKKHLREKAVRHNSMENTYKGRTYFTGVYTTDYFYACPKGPPCADTDKVLHFLTETIWWHYLTQPDVNLLTADEKHFKLTREGMGVYRFGTLKAKTDTSSGCRLRFSPDTGPPPSASCKSGLTGDVHPGHRLYVEPGVTIEHSENPNVIWGWGSKFTRAAVMHGFVDSRHQGALKSQDYVYFLGSGEMTSVILSNSAHYQPTNKVYMARIQAGTPALLDGKFEYYRGTIAGKSLWGSYDQATPLNTVPPMGAGSFTRWHGRYYAAVTCRGPDLIHSLFLPSHGMCVFSSPDGYAWGKPAFAGYSDLVGDRQDPAISTWLVYGHAWVPEGLYPHSDAIPYIFSVWKARGGYAADFWFKGKPGYPLPLTRRFYTYNTKMYLYWPGK